MEAGHPQDTPLNDPDTARNDLGRPLGTTRRDIPARLLLHHLPLGVTSIVLFALFMSLAASSHAPALDMSSDGVVPRQAAPMGAMDHRSGDPGDAAGSERGRRIFDRGFMARSTTATGYVATALLAATLLLGPANLLLRRRNPISTYFRRDVGTWTAVTSVVHVFFGLQIHGNLADAYNFLRYFLVEGAPRTNSFGLANWTGLAATVIVVGLLAISTDRSLRELTGRRWKNLQRLNYALFVLVVLHAYFYGALLRVTSPFALMLLGTVVAVAAGQVAGMRLWRQRARQRSAGFSPSSRGPLTGSSQAASIRAEVTPAHAGARGGQVHERPEEKRTVTEARRDTASGRAADPGGIAGMPRWQQLIGVVGLLVVVWVGSEMYATVTADTGFGGGHGPSQQGPAPSSDQEPGTGRPAPAPAEDDQTPPNGGGHRPPAGGHR